MKRLLVSALTIALLLTAVGATVLATNGGRSIDVFYRNITMTVNGKLVRTDLEPFIYENRTYVPLRVLAEATGVDVSWDDANSQVVINGRVSLEELTAQSVECRQSDGKCEIEISGMVVNRSSETVSSATMKCSAGIDGQDVIDGQLFKDSGYVGSGNTALFTKSTWTDKVVRPGQKLKVQCELLHVKYL